MHEILDERDHAWRKRGSFVLQCPDERRSSRKATPRQHLRDLEFRIGSWLDATKQFQHEPIVQERETVALIARAAGPARLGSGGQRIQEQAATQGECLGRDVPGLARGSVLGGSRDQALPDKFATKYYTQ